MNPVEIKQDPKGKGENLDLMETLTFWAENVFPKPARIGQQGKFSEKMVRIVWLYLKNSWANIRKYEKI